MKRKGIKEQSAAYIYAANALAGLRPYFHTISAVTTFAFIVGLVMAQQVVMGMVQDYPVLTYLLCALFAGGISLVYENKVSAIITSFGIVVSYGHSKRLIAAITLVCVPLVFIAGLTSYVGVKEAAHQTYINEGGVTAASITSLLNNQQTSTASTMKGRQQVIMETRSRQRETIIADHVNMWARSKAAGRVDSLYISKLQIKALTKHDRETEKLLAKTDKENMAFASGQGNAMKKVLDDVAEQQAISKARWLWLGKTGGTVAIICLILSTIASVTEQFIYRLLDISPQLNNGFTLSPTLFGMAGSGEKGGQMPVNAPPKKGRGVDMEIKHGQGSGAVDYDALTMSITMLNEARQAGGEKGDAAHEKMYDKIEQLNAAGYGVYFNDSENVITFDAKNKPTLKI